MSSLGSQYNNVPHPTTNVLATSFTSTPQQDTTAPTATLSISHSPSPPTDNGGGGSDGASIISLFVGVGVAGVVLISITVIMLTVLVCLRKRSSKVITADNVAYLSSSGEIKLTPNVAYTTTSTSEVKLAPNVAYTTTSTSEVKLAPNVAYTTTNVGTDIPTSTNLAYQTNTCQSASDDLTYDYVSL